MATFSVKVASTGSGSGTLSRAKSETKRLRPAMAMGCSISPRVQSVSHLWVQTRPQTAGKGLGSLATR